MQLITELITRFPPKDAQEIDILVRYIERQNFIGEDWQAVKRLFKKLEQHPIPELLVAIIYKLDKTALKQTNRKYPSTKTLGYMKRRAIRFLQKLAQENEDMFVNICISLFQKQTEPVDFSCQWILHNITFGTSKRFEQSRHGRGKITTKTNHSNIARQENNYTTIWDTHCESLIKLLYNKKLDIAIQEFIVKTLTRNKKHIPAFTNEQLISFYKSDSPWLQWIANQQCFEVIELGKMEQQPTLAYTYYYAPADKRKALDGAINEMIKLEKIETKSIFNRLFDKIATTQESQLQTAWTANFINQLARISFEKIGKTNSKSRQKNALDLVLQHQKYLSKNVIHENIGQLLNTSHAGIQQLVWNAAASCNLAQIKDWLLNIDHCSEAVKEKAYALFINKVETQNSSIREHLIRDYIKENAKTLSDFGWYILQHANLTEKTRNNIVANFFNANYYNFRNRNTATAYKNFVGSKFAAPLILKYVSHIWEWTSWDQKSFILLNSLIHEDLKDSCYNFIKDRATNQFFFWLPKIAQLESERESIIAAVEPILKSKNLVPVQMLHCIVDKDEWISTIAKRVFENKKSDAKTIQFLVDRSITDLTPDYTVSILSYLLRHNNAAINKVAIAELGKVLQKNPRYIDRLISFIDKIKDALPVEVILSMIEEANDDSWKILQPQIKSYTEGPNATAFWTKVLKLIPTLENDVLASRLIEDKEMLTSFYELTSEDVLSVNHPLFEEILFDWAKKQDQLFIPDSNLLFKGATHKFTKLRQWTIDKIKAYGMDNTFALQLMESDVPDAMNCGQSFFEKGKTDLEKLLALCDSPNKNVRSFGIEYFKTRQNDLDAKLALECLMENTDPQIQLFVAEQIQLKQANQAMAKQFDKAILRSKNRSRKAKELVKNRVDDNLLIDPQTLLELARGKNKKDANWAILQLTKLSIQGEAVEGFSLG